MGGEFVKKLGSVPLIRANGFGSLPRFLQERVSERGLMKVLKEEGLPATLIEPTEMPVPARSLIHLFARAEGVIKSRTLGLEVGRQMSYTGYGRWLQYSAFSPTLGKGIRHINATSWAHETAGYRFSLQKEGRFWLWRISRPEYLEGNISHSDHQIFPMIDFARVFLGHKWLPPWVSVDYPRDLDAGQLEGALRTPVHFGCHGVALPFTDEEISHSRVTLPEVQYSGEPVSNLYQDLLLRDAQEPARSFSAIVSLRLMDAQCDIEGAAKLAGVSVQGLQRRLRRAGYTYREVLDLARKVRASHLLQESDLSISDIAMALGYEEHSNFSRAFHRWMGCSPSQYRHDASTC